MRENRFAALAVIDRAAGEVAGDGYAQDDGAFEFAVGAPAHDAEFIADLHHGGPDVVEELNFGDGFHASGGHADCPAHDACFSEGRVEDSVGAIFALESCGGFEDAALPFYVLEIFLAAGVGNVFAEDGDAFVAGHFVLQRGGDHFDHGLWATVELGLGGEDRRGGINVGRIDVLIDGGNFRRRGGQGLVGGFADFAVDLGFEGFDFLLVHQAFANQEEGELGKRVAAGFAFAFFSGLVELFVVGERVRVGASNVCVDQGGAAAFADVTNGFLADGVAFEGVGAIAFGDVQVGEVSHEFRNATAGGLDFDGNGDGVTVVFDEIEERKFLGAGGVKRFPEFAFAGCAVAGGDVDDFFGIVIERFAEGSFLGLCEGIRMMTVIESGFGCSDGLHELRAGAGGLADDIEFLMAPVRGHLAAAGAGIVFGAYGLQKGFERGDA